MPGRSTFAIMALRGIGRLEGEEGAWKGKATFCPPAGLGRQRLAISSHLQHIAAFGFDIQQLGESGIRATIFPAAAVLSGARGSASVCAGGAGRL